MEIQSRVCRQLPPRRFWWGLQLRCAVDRRGDVHTPGQCSRCPKVDCRASESESRPCSCWQFSTTRSWEDVSDTQNAHTVVTVFGAWSRQRRTTISKTQSNTLRNTTVTVTT